MRFIELVLQGVRNFDKTHRFPLGEGVTAYIGGSGSGKSSWVDVLLYVLFPDSTELTTTAFKSGNSDICRVALTLDSGKEVYRLVKDLLRGTSALMKFNASKKDFSPISSSPSEILQYLSSTLHLPQQDVYSSLYVLRKQQLPSVVMANPVDTASHMADELGVGAPPGALVDGAVGTGFPGYQGHTGAGPGFPGYQGDLGNDGGSGFPGYQGYSDQGFDDGADVLPDDPKEIQSQIEILERDLASARMVDDLQFKLDGLQSGLFELEQKVKGVSQAQEKVDQLTDALKGMSNLANLPGDFEGRIRSYRANLERHKRDMNRLDEERDRWEKKAEQSFPVPLLHNRNFKLGLIGGVLALGAGVAGFFIDESLRWVALLDILFFGVALVSSFRHIDDIMGAERNKARLDALDQRRQSMERQFELESSIVIKTMEQVGVDSPEKVIEMYNKRNKLDELLQQAQQELNKQKAVAGLSDVEQRKAQVQSEIDSIEEQLAGMSGLMMSPSEMERKLGALRDKLEWKKSGGAGQKTSGPTMDAGYDLGVGAPPTALVGEHGVLPDVSSEVFAGLIEKAKDLFLVDTVKLNESISERAGQLLSAISARQMGSVTFDEKSRVMVFDGKSGSVVPVHDLSPEDMDKVYIALRFAVVEVFSKTIATPMLLDDPFGNFSPNMFEILGRVMAGLGRKTQLVMMASHVELAAHADSSYSL